MDHWILSDAERSKGFVRPVRRQYRHVGMRPRFPVRELTPEEQVRHAPYHYVAYEEYLQPASDGSSVTGRFWTAEQLASGCGTVTTMPVAIAESYAAKPSFYGSTFCCGCGKYLPVGAHGEFVWYPGNGPEERVGT